MDRADNVDRADSADSDKGDVIPVRTVRPHVLDAYAAKQKARVGA